MATGSLFSGIGGFGGFGSNIFSPSDFMGSFGSSLPWIPPVWAEEEAAQAEPVSEVIAESAETLPEEPTFGQTRTSWDPLGIEGYQATQGGLGPSLPTTYEGLGDVLSSIPTTTKEFGDLYSSFPSTWAEAGERITELATPMNLAKGAFSLAVGLPATAFFTAAKAMAESRKNARIRSQFPELGEAQTGFFGGTPELSDPEMISLAGYSAGAGEGMYTGLPAPGETRAIRAPSTELGWAPGDRAYDIMMDLQANVIANPAAWGLPENPYTPGYATPADLSNKKYAINGKKISEIIEEMAWNDPSVTGERDWVFDPMVYTEYASGPAEWGEKTVSTADFNYNYEDPYAGLPGYELGVQEEWDAAHIKNVELIAQYHADREKVAEEVKGIFGLPLGPGPWSPYADFPTAAETERMKFDATQRALKEAGMEPRPDPDRHAFPDLGQIAWSPTEAADVNAAAVAAAAAAADLKAQMEDEEAAGGGGPDPGDFGYGGEDSPW